jgi:hypothetical protein
MIDRRQGFKPTGLISQVSPSYYPPGHRPRPFLRSAWEAMKKQDVADLDKQLLALGLKVADATGFIGLDKDGGYGE